MPLTSISTQTIYDRMKADFNQKMGNSNWLSRAVALILIAVFAGAISLVYSFLNLLFKQTIPTLANEEWFTWHARFYGLNQILATPAQFAYRFTGTGTPTIPAETKLETDSGIVFLTDEEAVIAGGIADVGITAEISGTDGNVDVTTLTLVTGITDVDDEGTILSQTVIARDSETLDNWKSRLLQRIQNPPSCGNATDYQRWALQAGAGRVWVYDATDWLGPGTVGVVVATAALEAVDSTTKAAIVAQIESERPVGAAFDVTDPAVRQITLDISISPNTTFFQEAIDDALEEIFLMQSEPGSTMLLSQITKAISNTGVDDSEVTAIYEDLVSIGVANIEQAGIELSRYNGATYSAI